MSEEDKGREQAAYTHVCTSYHAVDDFRMKLLGLLPVATGTGVFLLLNSNGSVEPSKNDGHLEEFLFAMGLLGFAFTLGLFAFELYGIKRCHYLIATGRRLEVSLNVDGQFRNRPRELMRFVYEPLASGFIYSASMAAWLFLLVAFSSRMWQWTVPSVAFAVGMATTLGAAKGIERVDKREFRKAVLTEVGRHPTTTVARVSHALNAEEKAVRDALKGNVTVDGDATVASALGTMQAEKRPWLVVRDDEPLGTVGAEDLKPIAGETTVREVLGVATPRP